MRALFILSRILGNKTFSNQLISILPDFPKIQPILLTLDNEDYAKYRANVFSRKSNFYESHSVIRKKFKSLNLPSFDMVVIQGIGLVPAFRNIIRQYPTILATDSTPLLANFLTYSGDKSSLNRMKYYIKQIYFQWYYGNILDRIKAFLPRTEWCASSLRHHYRVKPEKILITPVSFDLNQWIKKKDRSKKYPILLFVGNDFQRKGGFLLIDIFSKYLSQKAILQIVSNDPVLKTIQLPQRIQLHSGIGYSQKHKLMELYQNADVLLLPTKHDYLPIVLIEGCAAGLPIIASNIGAVSEAVEDGVNGYLMPPFATEGEWVKKINYLIENKEKREEFGENSRKLAQRKFSIEIFKSNFKKAFFLTGYEI